jgi:hypothetical protein
MRLSKSRILLIGFILWPLIVAIPQFNLNYTPGLLFGKLNYVGGEGNYLNGEKVGEWKYYFEPWFGLGDVFHSEFYETRLDSIP